MRTDRLNFKFDIKALGAREFEGYGSIFGNVDLGDDVVMRGAFTDSLTESEKSGLMPQMFWMHQPDQVPGKWLEMSEDDNGLYVKGALADTQLGNESRTLLNMKAVRGLSIGYSIEDRTKDVSYNEDGVRMIHRAKLWEVSLVSLAMNPLAQVTASKARLSSAGEYVPTPREFERCLRDAGYSRKVACFITSKVFDDDPRGILDGHLSDSGAVDDDATELVKMLQQTSASMLAGAFRR